MVPLYYNKIINGTPVNFNGTPQLYANYNRDTINHFSVKCLLNFEFKLIMVSFFFFPFPVPLPTLFPWLLHLKPDFLDSFLASSYYFLGHAAQSTSNATPY